MSDTRLRAHVRARIRGVMRGPVHVRMYARRGENPLRRPVRAVTLLSRVAPMGVAIWER